MRCSNKSLRDLRAIPDYSLSDLWVISEWSLTVLCVISECSLSDLWMISEWSLSDLGVICEWLPSELLLFSECSPIVLWVWSKFAENVLSECSKCFLGGDLSSCWTLPCQGNALEGCSSVLEIADAFPSCFVRSSLKSWNTVKRQSWKICFRPLIRQKRKTMTWEI